MEKNYPEKITIIFNSKEGEKIVEFQRPEKVKDLLDSEPIFDSLFNGTVLNRTLEGLLQSCGLGFHSLSLHSDGRWIAKAGHGVLPTKKLFSAKTPEEALVKLLIAIEEK